MSKEWAVIWECPGRPTEVYTFKQVGVAMAEARKLAKYIAPSEGEWTEIPTMNSRLILMISGDIGEWIRVQAIPHDQKILPDVD